MHKLYLKFLSVGPCHDWEMCGSVTQVFDIQRKQSERIKPGHIMIDQSINKNILGSLNPEKRVTVN